MRACARPHRLCTASLLEPLACVSSCAPLCVPVRVCVRARAGASGASSCAPPSSAPQRPLRLALCQMHGASADVVGSLARLQRVLDAVAPLGEDGAPAGAPLADLVSTPELFLNGYHIGRTLLRATAVRMPRGEALREAVSSGAPTSSHTHPILALACMAARHSVAVHTSFAEAGEGDDAPLYISTVLFDTDGRLVLHYRKAHLWGAAYEKAIFTPGPGALPLASDVVPPRHHFAPVTLRRFPHVPLTCIICFDLEFPEVVRSAKLQGASLVLTCLASGDRQGFSSRAILPTRAAESHVAIAFCNYPSCAPPPCALDTAAPEELAVQYSGGTTLAAPDGTLIASLPVYVCAPLFRRT
ncbi:hypothetical protein EON68_02310, partial [archaeon]